jgi:xanthine/CO dehydrogenase XdhC/CoxF family maturation factor
MRAGELYARMAELSEHGPFVLATVIDVHGRAPAAWGRRCDPCGRHRGDHRRRRRLESEAVAEARACLASGESYSRTYNLRLRRTRLGA